MSLKGMDYLSLYSPDPTVFRKNYCHPTGAASSNAFSSAGSADDKPFSLLPNLQTT